MWLRKLHHKLFGTIYVRYIWGSVFTTSAIKKFSDGEMYVSVNGCYLLVDELIKNYRGKIINW